MTRLTRTQVREIDKRSIERYHIPGIVLMENAARAVADHAWKMYGRPDHAVLILCGGGNNGGDGLAVARHLHNRGAQVHLLISVDPAQYKGDALLNWNIVRAMEIPVDTLEDARQMIAGREIDLIVDGLFGTGLTKPPREPFDLYVKWVEAAAVPVIAIDLPSGLDCDTGQPFGSCVRATHTVTFVAEKAGFANPSAQSYTGEVIVSDIGCPRELIDEVIRDHP